MQLKYSGWRFNDFAAADPQQVRKQIVARFVLERAEARHLNVSVPGALAIETDDMVQRGASWFVEVRYGTTRFPFKVDEVDGELVIDGEESAPEKMSWEVGDTRL